MKVTGITPRGYCKGVVRAINIAKKATQDVTKQPLYILGMIVHNEYIVNALKEMGAITIEDAHKTRLELLDEIDHGTVIITAHGAGDVVSQKAREKGLDVIDASCLDVIKTHDLIKEELAKGYEILYIGKKNHPEAEGAMLIDPEHMHLIAKKEDFDGDGYPDLYVKEKTADINNLNTTGKYFKYDPEKGIYVDWDELNAIKFEADVRESSNKLMVIEKIDGIDYYQKYYEWNSQNQLVLKECDYWYNLKENGVPVENEYKQLVMHIEYTYYDENGNVISRETRDSKGNLVGENTQPASEEPKEE